MPLHLEYQKIFLRLLLFGVISQPIYDWANEFDHTGNVLFTLALGVLCIAVFQWIWQSKTARAV